MQSFKLRSITDWAQMLPGEVIEMETSASRRAVSMHVIASGRVNIYVASDPDMTGKVLAASSDGQFSLEYAAAGRSYVAFEAQDGVEIYIQTHARPQLVSQTEGAAAYTSVAPQNRRNTEFDRMAQLMRYNEARRDEHFKREISRVREELERSRAQAAPPAEPEVVEPEPAPAPAE